MTTRPTLRRGSTGPHVTYMQQRLRVHGIPVGVDGKFGPSSLTQILNFQRSKGLKVDGIVGPATWKALEAAPYVSSAPLFAEAKVILGSMGWRVNTSARLTQAIKDYQRMCNLTSTPLKVTGLIDPATLAALRLSKARRAQGKGDISEHFNAYEFRCKCNGAYSNCRRIWAHRDVVRACETYRRRLGGKSWTPISACRCTGHNRKVGGSTYSQHLYGLAIDCAPVLSDASMRLLKAASANGVQRSTGLVRHFDLRHLGPRNYPYATISRMHTYYY